MKQKAIFLVLAGMFLMPFAFAEDTQRCLEQTCFDKTFVIGSQELPLRGTALLEFMKVDMYTGALYAPQDAVSSGMVLDDVPKALVLHYHRAIKVSWMNRAAEKILKKNPEIDYAEIKERVDLISRAYQKVGKGDRYALVYEPLKGTALYLNGKQVITIPGKDFQKAYFGIWLSQYPARPAFRDQLLGGEGLK